MSTTKPKVQNGPDAAEIWETLSKIDVSDMTRERNKATYLSWAHAYGVMMSHYPQLEYEFESFQQDTQNGTSVWADACFYACTDKQGNKGLSASVHCRVTIGNVMKKMWLPVMTGYTNQASLYPDARDIGDAKMRCLTKCFAMFGLGHYIYAGEDLPIEGAAPKAPPKKEEPKKPEPKLLPEGLALLEALHEYDSIADAEKLTGKSVTDDKQTQMFAKINLMGGSKQCPRCNMMVTGMSKCRVTGQYHVDLI